MGQPKALLHWEGTTLLQYQAQQLCQTLAEEVVVVLGDRSKEYERLLGGTVGLDKVRVAVNRDFKLGKAGSIKKGLASIKSEPDAVMVLAVDQPRHYPLLQRLFDAHIAGKSLITVPMFRGRHGHPPIFSWSLKQELLSITEERRGLRQVMEAHKRNLHEVDLGQPVVLVNINTAEEYQSAVRLAG